MDLITYWRLEAMREQRFHEEWALRSDEARFQRALRRVTGGYIP